MPGTDQGLAVGMPVVGSADGAGALAGSIVSVGSDTATVRLIVDTRSSVVALDQRTRALGLVQGQLGGQLVMVQVDVTDDLAEGDQVVTAGLELAEGAARSPYPQGPAHRPRPGGAAGQQRPHPDRVRAAGARLRQPGAPAGGDRLPAGLMAGGASGHMAPSAVTVADHRGIPDPPCGQPTLVGARNDPASRSEDPHCATEPDPPSPLPSAWPWPGRCWPPPRSPRPIR